jgi:predicted RNA binding protein YcfA (HicA-like mRNA interferase family)
MLTVENAVEFLDRENALELENEEQTYQNEQIPQPVIWENLFPTQARLRELERGEFSDDPWQLDFPDLDSRILRAVEAGQPVEDEPWPRDRDRDKGIWDVCAWYQPIHYFGNDWGIFIREDCLKSQAIRIAGRLDPSDLRKIPGWRYQGPGGLTKAMLRASFACFFLHEQFHHKIESLGFRLHVARGQGSYLPYKKNVYRPNYLTDNCLEEALANADIFKRISEQTYKSVMGDVVVAATKHYLRSTFPSEQPGYRKAVDYLTTSQFRDGLNHLQAQVRYGSLTHGTNQRDWLLAPRLTQSFFNLKSEIYVIVPPGQQAILPTQIFPKTCSTREMERICRNHGYSPVSGGKGSHIKMKKRDAPTITLPGNRKDLSPGVVKSVLRALGNYNMNDLPSLTKSKSIH